MVEWLDERSRADVRCRGSLYLGLDKPSYTAASFLGVPQVECERGYPENVDLLMPYITVLPEGVPANINTII